MFTGHFLKFGQHSKLDLHVLLPQLLTSILNSIRHNLSLHKKFLRIRNDSVGKSSWWTVNAAAGSGRTPRRKGTYRRRKGKAILPQHTLESLPALFKHKRRSLFHNNMSQRNFWGGIPDLHLGNNHQYTTEPLKGRFQSFTRSEEINSNSNHSKPFILGESLPPFSALNSDRSWKNNFSLPSVNPYQSEQLFIAQTASLKTETNSCGSFNNSCQTYRQEHFISYQTSFKQMKNKTVSTEYFMSPHHLSGSSITTEVERNKIESDNSNLANINQTSNSLLSSVDSVYQEILPKNNHNLSTDEMNSLLNNKTCDDSSDFRAVFNELNEMKKPDEYNSKINDKLKDQLTTLDLHIDKNISILNQTNLMNFDQMNKLVDNQKESFSDSIAAKPRIQSSEVKNTSLAFQKGDLNFNPNQSKEDLFSFINKTTNESRIAPYQSDSIFLEEIIRKLNSSHSDLVDSRSMVDKFSAYQENRQNSNAFIDIPDRKNAKALHSLDCQMHIPHYPHEICANTKEHLSSQLKFLEEMIHDNINIDCKNVNISQQHSSIQRILPQQSDSMFIEDIIQNLNSPYPNQFLSENEMNEIPIYHETFLHPRTFSFSSDENTASKQNINVNIEDFRETKWRQLTSYSENNDTKSEKVHENIPEALLNTILSNSGMFLKSTELENIHQNIFPVECMNISSNCDANGNEQNVSGSLNSEALLSPSNSLSKTTETSIKYSKDECNSVEINNLSSPSESETSSRNEKEDELKDNVFRTEAKQKILQGTYDFNTINLGVETCKMLKKTSITNPLNNSTEFSDMLDLFDKYNDSCMLDEKGDPCLMIDSSNSNHEFDNDLPSLSDDKITDDGDFNLDFVCNQKETSYSIENSIFEYMQNEISPNDKNCFDILNFATSDSETDSKDDNLFKYI
ncbi:fork-head domain-containing protein [Caerostris darwini]|uniref:Fork-head domain-containing protein n=1 Tax=Caerostris darwini TaxID=1538125 RepID=A0AAV4RY28_9ARAC|nr:fork-head domain-containing protein [Caerostris darwini]